MNIDIPERLEKYIHEFEEDVKLNMTNVKDKSLMVTSYQSKWIRYYFAEKTLNQKLKDAKVEYSRQSTATIDFKQQLPGTYGRQSEMDQKLVKLNNEIKTSEMCLDFMEKSMAVLDKMNFQIKNVIDLTRLELGG